MNEIYHAEYAQWFHEPWAILPERFAALMQAARSFLAGEEPPEAARPAPASRATGAVAIVPISGPIFPRGGGLWADLFGGTSAEKLSATLRAAASDQAVSAIVLDVNSPGGSVAGIAEAAAVIRDAGEQKPVVAISHHMAASAAYWLASQAGRLVVSPSSQTGSIGVFAAHADWSAALEKAGVKVSLISAGKFKVEGNPYSPLTDEARSAIQAVVDEYYDAFVSDVAKGRQTKKATVREGFGEGRLLGARDAVSSGMADEIGTLDDAIMAAAISARGRPALSAAELEFRQRRARAMGGE